MPVNYAAATTLIIETACKIKLADDNRTTMAFRNISIKIVPLRKVTDASAVRPISNLINWEPKEIETHTGQKWDKDDYRMCRFVDKTKHVNPNWAIKLIAEAPPIEVEGRVASCDGGGGPTGHPRIFINLDKPGCHPCLYCGLRFYKKDQDH